MIGTTWCATRGVGGGGGFGVGGLGDWGTPYNGLYGKAPPNRDTLFESPGI